MHGSKGIILDNSVPVVLLASSQHGGLGIIRSLGREGIPVYGVHRSLWEPAARSRYLRGAFRWDFATAAPVDSVSFLHALAGKIPGRPILVATSDETAMLVAEHAGTLGEGYRLATPTAEVFSALSSKKRMYDLCCRLGIATPVTALPTSRGEILDIARKWPFPMVVKGECGALFRSRDKRARVIIVSSDRELVEIFDLNSGQGAPRMILQEYIPGDDTNVWMFNGYFNDRSECLFGATGRKLRQFPPHRGTTSLGICLANDTVAAQTLRLMRQVGYRGLLDLGYRFDARDGQYKLLDVNPRIGATFRLFVAGNGLDAVRALYLDLTGQAIPSAQVAEGRKWIVESNDLISSWSYLRSGDLKLSQWLSSFRGVQERVWFSRDDLLPLFMLPFLWFQKRVPALHDKLGTKRRS